MIPKEWKNDISLHAFYLNWEHFVIHPLYYYFECVCVFVSDYGSVYPLLCDAVPASCVGSVTMLLSHSTFLLYTRHTCRTTVSNLWCTVSPAYTLLPHV